MENQKVLEELKDVISKQMPDINKMIKDMYEELHKYSPNILICGKSGVGKSTLINSVFRENIADTGIGKPITTIIRKYSNEDVPVNIYDTPGFEAGKSENIEEVINFIVDLNSDTDPNKHIHVMWYCIAGSGARIENGEIEFMKKINESTNVPVIILLTKCDQDQEETEKLNVEIKKINLPISNLLIVSAKKNINLDKLITITNQLIPEAFRRAFMNAQIVNIEEKEKASKKYLVGYVSGSAISGFSPVPFSSWILIVPIQLTMLIHISIIFGLEIDKSIIQNLLGGTLSTAGATFLGRFLSNLLKFIPGVGTITGGILDAAVAGSITSAMGLSYIKLLSRLMKSKIKGEDISSEEMEKIINDELTKKTK